MKKLVERGPARDANPLATAPGVAVQFFLIPLAVVGVVVLVYGGFRMLMSTERTPEEYLSDVRTGGRERRWPAAYELSRLLADPEVERQHPRLGAAIVQAFVDSEGDDPRLRRYLALAIGRLDTPPAEAIGELVDALDDPDSETRISMIWALASIGDTSVVADIEAMYASDDAGVRKMVVYALGALPPDAHFATLRNAIDDPAADVQWNAAVALARHGRTEGVPVLRRMIDRDYVSRMVTRAPTADATIDPVSEVMVSSLQALAALKAAGFQGAVERLSREDQSLRVREVALRTLGAIGPAKATDAVSAVLNAEP